MSIHNKRLERLTERILREELQKGNLPTSKEFAWRLSEHLDKQDLSRPEFIYRSVRNGMLAYAERQNEEFRAIHNDFSLLYENIREVHEMLGRHFSKFEVEKDILEKEIFAIETSLREKVLLYAQSGFLTAVFDVFETFDKMDAEASSNILLDVKNHEVRLVEELRLSKRVEAPATSFVLRGNFEKKVSELGMPLEVIHRGYGDESWQQMVHTREDREVTGELVFAFEGVQEMNQLVLSLMTVRPVYVSVTYTPDDINWLKLPYHESEMETSSGIDLKFPTVGMRAMKVTIRKPEHDEQVAEEEGYEFRYLFGVKNVEMRTLRFPENGVFQSRPLMVDGPNNYVINKVSLDVEETLPTGTDIFYEVSIAGTDDWRGISPLGRANAAYPKVVDFQRIVNSRPSTFSMGGELSVNQYEVTDLRANGISFYSLGKVSGRRILDGSERLYVGRNTWECRYYLKDRGDTHAPTLSDWVEENGEVFFDYEKMSETRRSLLFEGKKGAGRGNYYCRAGVLYEGRDEIVSARPSSTEPIAMYVNGEKVFEGYGDGSSVNLRLKQGWNELVVLVYGKNMATVNGMTVDLGLDMMETFENMYLSTSPMEKVPMFDLRYNTKITDRTRYSIRETEEGYELITNFGVDGLEFDFFFDYALASDVEGKEIVLRARFVREGEEDVPSPVLRRYRLRFA